jgi:hypothetical protein
MPLAWSAVANTRVPARAVTTMPPTHLFIPSSLWPTYKVRIGCVIPSASLGDRPHSQRTIVCVAGEERSVYELITRHFLACCSKDAVGQRTTATADIAGETFTAKGLMITERNYLDIYKWDRWTEHSMPGMKMCASTVFFFSLFLFVLPSSFDPRISARSLSNGSNSHAEFSVNVGGHNGRSSTAFGMLAAC